MHTFRIIGIVSSLALLGACAGSNAAVKGDAAADLSDQNTPACSREIDVRFSSNNANCTSFGHSYSSDDLRRNGATTTGAELRLLDPTITIH